jgi:hypothetical protein
MKNNLILIAVLLSILFTTCSNQESNQVDLKDSLVERLIASSELSASINDGKIIIIETRYCETFDCEAYFQDYKDKIKVYSREDVFMMQNITSYIEIEHLNEASGHLIYRKKTGEEIEIIEIKL